MGRCVRNHTMVVHQPVVHITKHLSECEWCTLSCSSQCHSVRHSHTRMAPVHNIPKCDVSGMVVVVVEHLVDVMPCCSVAEWDGASSSLVDQVSTHPKQMTRVGLSGGASWHGVA